MSRNRKSIRLKGFDYGSSAVYFVTICTHERQHLFGEVQKGEMHLSEMAVVVRTEWFWSEVVRPGLLLDAFVIMPNHIHGIVGVNLDSPSQSAAGVGAQSFAPLQEPTEKQLRRAKRSLSTFVSQFKATVTKSARRENPGLEVWQRNYHERIIRDAAELEAKRRYVEHNPAGWDTDEENQ